MLCCFVVVVVFPAEKLLPLNIVFSVILSSNTVTIKYICDTSKEQSGWSDRTAYRVFALEVDPGSIPGTTHKPQVCQE